MRERRLLLVANVAGGGLGAAVRAQASWFAEHGWRVAVALPRAGAAPVVAGIEWFEVAIPPSARDTRAMLAAARELHAIVRRWQPAITHAHGLRAFLLAGLASARRPYVTLHGSGAMAGDPVGYGLLRSSGLLVVPWLARRAYDAGADHRRGWSFLPHASPRLGELTALEPASGPEPPLILWLGGLVEPKRPDLFVRAIASAARRTPVRGVIAGEGVLRSTVERLVDSLAAPVDLVGRVQDVRPLLAQATAVVLLSRFEALAFAVQEAMWAGRPVVASRLDSLQWLLGDVGIYADDVEEATAAITRLASERQWAAEVGRRAATRIRTLVAPDSPWPATETDYLQDLESAR